MKSLIHSANVPGVLTARHPAGVWGTTLMKEKLCPHRDYILESDNCFL